jgi:hypothetical protein
MKAKTMVPSSNIDNSINHIIPNISKSPFKSINSSLNSTPATAT